MESNESKVGLLSKEGDGWLIQGCVSWTTCNVVKFVAGDVARATCKPIFSTRFGVGHGNKERKGWRKTNEGHNCIHFLYEDGNHPYVPCFFIWKDEDVN